MTAAEKEPKPGPAASGSLLLHPVRMRIIQAVTGGRFTTRELAQALPDVPPATLYRQLAKLVAGGLLAVAGTRRVRGAVERTYAIAAPANVGPDELAGFSREDHLRLFQSFAGMLLADHRRYLEQPDADPMRDVRFRQPSVTLSESEADALQRDIDAQVQAAAAHAKQSASPERRPRLLTLIMMPAAQSRPEPGDHASDAAGALDSAGTATAKAVSAGGTIARSTDESARPGETTMAASTRLMTAAELEQMPDDGYRYDIIRGELIKMAPAGARHGRIAFRLGELLAPFVREHSLGELFAAETGFVFALDPDVLLGPDLAFIRADRMPPEEEQDGFLHLAPDLVVEVVSPSDRAREVNDKVMEYLDGGVRLVWLIEPRRKLVTVFGPDRTARILTNMDELDGGDVLPGFRVPVTAIFR